LLSAARATCESSSPIWPAQAHYAKGISREEAADVIWATNSPEFYVLLVHERGWDPDHYAHWLADAWRRLLLRDT